MGFADQGLCTAQTLLSLVRQYEHDASAQAQAKTVFQLRFGTCESQAPVGGGNTLSEFGLARSDIGAGQRYDATVVSGPSRRHGFAPFGHIAAPTTKMPRHIAVPGHAPPAVSAAQQDFAGLDPRVCVRRATIKRTSCERMRYRYPRALSARTFPLPRLGYRAA